MRYFDHWESQQLFLSLSTVELVQSAQKGDQEAFAELMYRFRPQIFAICLRYLRNFHSACDVCQDVFLTVFLKFSQLNDPKRFPGWITSIAVRHLLNRLHRDRRVTVADPEILGMLCDDGEDPEDAEIFSEQRALLHTAMSQLSELDQSTLIDHYFKGKSLREMSEHYNTPIGTIKSRLHAGRARLAEKLDASHCL